MPEASKRLAVPPWAWVAALGVLALALRLVYIFQVGTTSLVSPEELDPGFYYNWAKQIAAGDWRGTASFVQSPLYAYLLGVLMMFIGADVTRILVVQALVGTGTVLLTYVLGRRLLGHWHGMLAGLLVALYGPFLFFEGMVMKTFLSPFLTVLMLLVLDRARQEASAGADAAPDGAPAPATPGRRAMWLFGLGGVVYGLTTLDRDNFILLAPALAVLVAWLGGGLNRRGLRSAAAFTLGTVLMIAPVTLRNWIVSHEFVLLTTGGGEVFFIGNNADANGLYVPPPFVRPDPKYEHGDFVARASEISGKNLTAMQSSWFWFHQGVEFIREEPLGWARLIGRKMVYFWNYYELADNLDYVVLQRFSGLLAAMNVSFPPEQWPTLVVPSGGSRAMVRIHLYSTFGTLAPLGLLGIYLTRRSWRRLLPLHVVLFGYMGTVLLFFNFARFRVPVVPILALFAAESLFAIARGLRRLWALIVAFATRSGDMVTRARDLFRGWGQAVACVLFALVLVGFNVERPRGVLPEIERALVTGNGYYANGDIEPAQQSFLLGLLLLGEGPPGERGDAELQKRFGPEVTRAAISKELEAEAIARGPQFKGIHVGVHHGLGLTLLAQAGALLDKGERVAALPLLDRAMAQFAEALRLAPAYLLSIRKMAMAYDLKGDHSAAVEWLRRGVDLWPEDLQARAELAEALFRAGEYREALKLLDEARQLNADMDANEMARLYFNRGLILYQGMNEPGRALYNFEKSIAIDPNYSQASVIRSTILSLRARGIQPLPDEPETGKAPAAPPSPASPDQARPAPVTSGR
ncbi:MAG TPA: glycosyltransferase family 39 protein [Candidatus Polarisedimenticolia bacterium]|nr:glycosyltransferase family 39 protein [Candidatus Polarisedimenticolia bacterium]